MTDIFPAFLTGNAQEKRKKAVSSQKILGKLKKSSIIQKRNTIPILYKEVGEGAVVCMMPMVIPLDEKNKLIPVSCI